MKCDRCDAQMKEEDAIPQGSQMVCDDCAMTLMSPSQPCDPWAVKMATGSFTTKADAVAAVQGNEKKLYELIEAQGRVASEAVPATLGLTPEQVKRAMATLRHMELVRGDRREDGGADFVLFDS